MKIRRIIGEDNLRVAERRVGVLLTAYTARSQIHIDQPSKTAAEKVDSDQTACPRPAVELNRHTSHGHENQYQMRSTSVLTDVLTSEADGLNHGLNSSEADSRLDGDTSESRTAEDSTGERPWRTADRLMIEVAARRLLETASSYTKRGW